MQHVKVSLHRHFCCTLSHTFRVTKHRCVSITAALTAPTPNPSPDIPALLPAHEQHFPPPLEACTELSSLTACRQSWASLMEWELLQDPPAVPATPGVHPQCLHPPLPAAQEAPWKLKRSFPAVTQAGCAHFPVRALPWSRQVPAAGTQHHLGIYCIWLFLVHRHRRGN